MVGGRDPNGGYIVIPGSPLDQYFKAAGEIPLHPALMSNMSCVDGSCVGGQPFNGGMVPYDECEKVLRNCACSPHSSYFDVAELLLGLIFVGAFFMVSLVIPYGCSKLQKIHREKKMCHYATRRGHPQRHANHVHNHPRKNPKVLGPPSTLPMVPYAP
jgi:hypothetical protein